MNIQTYDAKADGINIEDIAANSNNRIVLRRIQRNSAEEDDDTDEYLWIQDQHDNNGEACVETT